MWLSCSIHDLQARDCRFKLLAGLNLLWCCAPRQDIDLYPHMHSLNPEVSGYLVGQGRLVCLNSFCDCVPKMAARRHASLGIEMAYINEWTGPMTRGVIV